MKLTTGALVTLEGIDGSGKSSIARILKDHLSNLGYTVTLTKEPGATELGKNLRLLLNERTFKLSDKTEFLLFAADRAQHFFNIVEPALQQGHIVICDRMADSSLAYQGFGRNVDKHVIKTVNDWAMNYKVPNLTLYLKIEYEDALQRVRRRQSGLTHFEKEEPAFFNRIIQGYEKIFSERQNVLTIDASRSFQEVSKDAIESTLNFLSFY